MDTPLHDFDRTHHEHDSPQARARALERFTLNEARALDVFADYQVEVKALKERHRLEAEALEAEWQPALNRAARKINLP